MATALPSAPQRTFRVWRGDRQKGDFTNYQVPVDPGMVTVGHERRTADLLPHSDPKHCDRFVSDEADDRRSRPAADSDKPPSRSPGKSGCVHSARLAVIREPELKAAASPSQPQVMMCA